MFQHPIFLIWRPSTRNSRYRMAPAQTSLWKPLLWLSRNLHSDSLRICWDHYQWEQWFLLTHMLHPRLVYLWSTNKHKRSLKVVHERLSFYQETNIHDHNITFYLLLIFLQLFNVQQIIDDYSLCFQIYAHFFAQTWPTIFIQLLISKVKRVPLDLSSKVL